MPDTYSLEMLERCAKWCRQDEGKIFWRWMINELGRVTEGSSKYLGAWETGDIVKANKMLAREEEARYISEFVDRLDFLIKEKKKLGEVLTDIEEI